MSQIEYRVPLPEDGVITWQKVEIYRSADVTPKVWVLQTTALLDEYREDTFWTDTSGALTSWYRHRYQNTALTNPSDYSEEIQQGDYLIRQWCRADMTDTDITTTDWDRWRDQTIQDLSMASIGRDADYQDITTASETVEWFDLRADIKTVTSVEIYSGGSLVTATPHWRQRGRKVRILYGDTAITYRVYGKGEVRSLSDVDNEMFMLVYWGMRKKLIDKRIWERANFKFNQSAEKVSDISPEALLRFKAEAEREWLTRLEQAARRDAMPF